LAAATSIGAAVWSDGARSQTSPERAESKPAPAGAKAYIIWPSDGQVIPGGKFWLRMGLTGMGIAPAGVDSPKTGHHHVLVDVPLPKPGEAIPNDKNHLHFGAGQTEARIELPPGKHTLQLVLGDAEHVPHDPPVISARISVIVPEERVSEVTRLAVAAAMLVAAPAWGQVAAPGPGQPPRTSAPADSFVYIGWPNDGEVIRSTRFKVWFGARHIGVAPAGVVKANTGHHHLLIDTPLPRMDEPIPNDKNHLHFGAGQTETMLELPPGKHTLQLLMGDADHIPHQPAVMSKPITITVAPR
jgi:hypothetical protein